MEINLSCFCNAHSEPLAEWFVCLPSELNTIALRVKRGVTALSMGQKY